MKPASHIRAIAVWRWPAIALLLAVIWLPASAQTAAGSVKYSAGSGAGLYRIAGTVVNDQTGEPLQHATVAVLAEADSHTVESVETGSDGRFSLPRLPAAKYQLTASKRGFRTAFYDEHQEFSTAVVTGPGQETERLVFRMMPSSVLHGAITGDGGDPVEGAKVMLFLVPPDHGHVAARGRGPNERVRQVESATSDDTGAYEFSNLAAGKYMLAVTAEPWYALHLSSVGSRAAPGSGASAALDVAYPVTFFDSTTEEASATPIVLAAGSREEANVVLHPAPALHIFVQVPREHGNFNGLVPPPSMRRSVFGTPISSDAQFSQNPAVSSVAEFTGVAPGHYELQQGNPPRIVDLDAATSQQVDPADGIPTVTVSGDLAGAFGAALPDDMTVILSSLDNGQRQDQQASAHKGHFRFETVLPGKWELQAWGPAGPFAVVSVTANGATRGGNALTVADRALTITAALAQGETRVEGFARKDGKGFAGAMVVLAPKNKAAFQALVRRDQSDSDGSFSLRDAVPGQYIVVAIEDGWKLDWSRPEVLGRFLPKGVPVTVTETSGKTIQLSDPIAVQTQ
jgi:hypothetical protein